MQSAVFQEHQVFFVQNTVTFETVALIRKNVLSFMEENPSIETYSIDLRDVKEVNSAALGLLVELKKYTIARKKMVIFLNLPERLTSLAKVYGVAEWLNLHSCA